MGALLFNRCVGNCYLLGLELPIAYLGEVRIWGLTESNRRLGCAYVNGCIGQRLQYENVSVWIHVLFRHKYVSKVSGL
jgi:hypothetical protein